MADCNHSCFQAFGTINHIYADVSNDVLCACKSLCLSLHQKFNRFDKTSELASLNAHAGQEFRCSQDMASVLQVACALYEESEGLYNVAVGPLSDLWHFTARDDTAFRVPEPSAVESALARTNLSLVELHQSREESAARLSSFALCREDLCGEVLRGEVLREEALRGEASCRKGRPSEQRTALTALEGEKALESESTPEPESAFEPEFAPKLEFEEEKIPIRIPSGMRLDLGSIAKGYAADRAAAFLWSQGARHGFLNFGGTILVLGPKADGSAWSFGLQSASAAPGQEHWVALELHWGALAVSSGYERGANCGKRRFHHIINPKTGYPVENGVAETAVLAQNAMMADALSTAAFVMGPESAFDLVHSLNAALLFRMEDGRVRMTQGFPVRR